MRTFRGRQNPLLRAHYTSSRERTLLVFSMQSPVTNDKSLKKIKSEKCTRKNV